MDPLSMAASVAGVATMGVQLSQTIYNLISTFYEAEREMSSIANDLSLLAMVLNELEGVLRRDSRVYRRRMVRVVSDILNNCEDVFESISKYIVANPQDMKFSQQFQRKVRWYFQRHRVRPLQAGLESMKSTLNVLLHVVHLARVTEEAESFVPNPGMVFTHADVQNERRNLVEVVLDNRRSIMSLKQIEEDRDRGHNLGNVLLDNQANETDSDLGLDDRAPILERNFRPREKMGSGGSYSFGDWRGGSCANTAPNTSLFSKAAKEPAAHTTYSNAQSLGSSRNKHKGDGDDLGASTTKTTTTKKKHKERRNDPVDGVSNVENPTFMDNTVDNSEIAAHDSWYALDAASSKGRKQEDKKQRHEENRDLSPCPSVSASSASHCEEVLEVYEISESGSTSRGPKLFVSRSESGHTNETDGPLGSHVSSLPQSPASVYYSTPPEIPINDGIEPHHSEKVIPSMGPYTSSTKDLGTKLGRSQQLPSPQPPPFETRKIVTPTAQWFLSVVPHESSISALIVRPRTGEAEHLRIRAEETAKTLLLDWTNVDPDVVSGAENSGSWNTIVNSNPQHYGPAQSQKVRNQPYRVTYPPQAYPQHWYEPPVFTASPSPNEIQTDSEELAHLKKLILDEKAEQDRREAALAAVAPPAIPSAPIVTEEVPEDIMQHETSYMEAVDSIYIPQEYNSLGNEKPPKPQPVIMKDWLHRKFIFPVDMCQTWEGLHNLLQEAFGHLPKYRPMVEKGNYIISHGSGKIILPSTWESLVQPSLEINMVISNLTGIDRDELGGEAFVGGSRDNAAPETLVPPLAPGVPRLGSSWTLQSRSDDESVIDDVADYETDNSFPDWISFVERSDPRYLSIEKVLLEQKRAKVGAEMKHERNRRFFQLKQQLVDQGAAIQARQEAAEQAEQDTKLAWLEKQVRDQKEELDRIPPLLMTPPSSSAGYSTIKPASNPRRKPSLGARLMGRLPSRSKDSVRSQQMITEG